MSHIMYKYRYFALALLVACGPKSDEPAKAGQRRVAGPDGPTASAAAQERFKKALAELEAMTKAGKIDYATLKPLFKAALKEDDNFAEAHYNMGLIAESEGNVQDAEKSYRRALQINPKLGHAAQNLAVILVSRGKEDEAVDLLEHAIKNDPTHPRPRVALAQILRSRKKYEDALEHLRAALQSDPKNLAAFQAMSVTYADLGNPPMARLVGARGLKVDDKDAVIHYTRGRLLLAENKIIEAVLELKRALEADPELRPARVDLAEVALNYRDFGNAKAHYQKLLEGNPNDVSVLVNLGIANKGLGLADEAKASYEKALSIDKQNPAATMNLAILYHKNFSDFDNALKYYQAYQQKPASEGGPDEATLKGAILECEQTIAALKEAEKFEQQMQRDAATAQPEAKPDAQVSAQTEGGEQPAAEPAADQGAKQ
jgi:tetratricopeptide (TPR) repeat protein